MPESNLTKKIKQSLRYYRPAMSSNMRTIRFAEEVYVGSGYVDSIRFEDYIESEERIYICRKLRREMKNLNNPLCMEKESCKGCIHKLSEVRNRTIGILVTCFEVKISKNDFKSKHGHNFKGNRNYYVIPKELYHDIKDLVPNDIGIILYYGPGSLRVKKECEAKDIDKRQLSFMLYHAMKKWVDKFERYY